ncbi:MAG: hypothetical protein E7271_11190 [Lachnospiraceae bacterium]|jgi:3D (Asp-Asp-Asp) domain-containing protein|nr:hypothetical protein [Lachnospiraceae bacterium]
MKKSINFKTILGVIILVIVSVMVVFLGYRVIITSIEVPGKLSSISAAAVNLNHSQTTMKQVKKVDYNTMKYGYMDGLLIAQMDEIDKVYEHEQMEEIRAVNDLTAMSDRTADKIAYEKLKAEREEKARQAKIAAAQAEAAKRAQAQQQAIDNSAFVDTGSGDTAARGGRKGVPVYADSHGESLGKFVVTAYCTCKICCGIYSGHNRTASGTVPTSNRTIAVDTDVIPFGTRVVINGQVYVAEDRGSAIVGKRIDMFFMTHAEATRWGKKTVEVFLAD